MRSVQSQARAAGDLQWLQVMNLQLAETCLGEEVGEEQEVEAALQETLDLGVLGNITEVRARCLLSVQRARQGEPAAARRLLSDAHEQAAERGELVRWESYLSWAEANLAMTEGHWPEALAAFEATVDTMGHRKLRWQRARTLIDWAEVHLARGESGDRERAGELLREAEAEFEAMGASSTPSGSKGAWRNWLLDRPCLEVTVMVCLPLSLS
jgi:hypothetical protein